MDLSLQFEMAQGIARAIVASPDFSPVLKDYANQFVHARDYWITKAETLWETDSVGWKYLQAHRNEWEGKL